MPTYNKFNAWAEYMVEGANLGSDQFAVALTNSAPSASNSVIADITQISYTGLSSRNITTTSSSQTSGAFSLVFANLTLTASASVGPFRYVVIYDDTVASDPLVGWYDLGASMSLGASEGLVLQGVGLDMAGGFTPASLFTGGYTGGWYDPSDISTLWQNSARTTPVTTDGDPVGAIDDKSGGGNHLTQGTTGKKPQYKTSGGLHWLEFDGVDDGLESTASGLRIAGNLTLMMGAREDTTATYNCFMSCLTGPGTTNLYEFRSFYTGSPTEKLAQFVQGNGATVETVGVGASPNVVPVGTNFIGTVERTVTNFNYQRNNATSGNATLALTPSVAGTETFRLGVRESGNIPLDGRIYQALVINKTLTAGEKVSLKDYQAAKTGVTL